MPQVPQSVGALGGVPKVTCVLYSAGCPGRCPQRPWVPRKEPHGPTVAVWCQMLWELSPWSPRYHRVQGAPGGVPKVPHVLYSTSCARRCPQSSPCATQHRVPREVSLAPLTPWLPPQERRSALRDPSSPRRRPGARVRLNPLVLLLDAALTGELDVVQQAVAEVGQGKGEGGWRGQGLGESGDRVAGTRAGVARAGGQWGQGDGGQGDGESDVPGA